MTISKPLKPFPTFATDQEAEDFVDHADLTEYDFSEFKPVRFKFTPKPATVQTGTAQDFLDVGPPSKKTT